MPRKRHYGFTQRLYSWGVLADNEPLAHFSRTEIESRVSKALDKIKTRLGDANYLPGQLNNSDAKQITPAD